MKKTMHRIEKELLPLKKKLIEHPLYHRINSVDDVQSFMEKHVFAVWDFMSLVKKLQLRLTSTTLPWTPSKYPVAGRLINEIVWGEETDVNKDGEIMSHFEMYLQAMEEVNADTKPILGFIEQINNGESIENCLLKADLPAYVKDFLSFTFATIEEDKVHVIASVFTFGREDLIPDMFIEMVKNIRNEKGSLLHLIYYLDRHIEVDGGEHGPMALQMIEQLCNNDPVKIQEAIVAAKKALALRISLWDGILAQLTSPVLI